MKLLIEDYWVLLLLVYFTIYGAYSWAVGRVAGVILALMSIEIGAIIGILLTKH